MSPLAPELMRMVAAGLEGKTLATPDPPLVIVIGPGLDPSTSGLVDSVSIVRRPPDAASGGASIASPGVAITVLPTTVTGLFAGENTSTVVVIGDPGKVGPNTCACAPLAVRRASGGESRTMRRAPHRAPMTNRFETPPFTIAEGDLSGAKRTRRCASRHN
jgi:hypothetical protein